MPLCHVVTPVGMLGYGLDEAVTSEELACLTSTGVPTAIILDSGSTDSGPSKLATGAMTVPRSSYKRDLRKLVGLVLKHRVPLLISSAGGDGSDAHVDEMLDIIEEILEELQQNDTLKVIDIYSEISKPLVEERLQSGKINGFVTSFLGT